MLSNVSASFQFTPALTDPELIRADPSKAVKNSGEIGGLSRTAKGKYTQFCGLFFPIYHLHRLLHIYITDDAASGGQMVDVNCCSSDDTAPKTRPAVEIHEQKSHGLPSRGFLALYITKLRSSISGIQKVYMHFINISLQPDFGSCVLCC